MRKFKKAITLGLAGSAALVAGTVLLLSNQSNDSANARLSDVSTHQIRTAVQDVPKHDVDKMKFQETEKVEKDNKEKTIGSSTNVENKDVADLEIILPKEQKEIQTVAISSNDKETSSSPSLKQEKQVVKSSKTETVNATKTTDTSKKVNNVSSKGTSEKQSNTSSSKTTVTKQVESKKVVSQPTKSEPQKQPSQAKKENVVKQQPKPEPKKEVKPQPKPEPKKESQTRSPYTGLTEEEMLREIERMRGDIYAEPDTVRVGAEEFEKADGYLFEFDK